MSHETGTYLGGIRSIEDLRLRCRLDEDTGCWHWTGATECGAPKLWVASIGKVMVGYRAAKILAGTTIKPGHHVWPTCRSRDCLNPAHSTTGTRAAMSEWKRRNRPHRLHPATFAAATRKRRRRYVLDPEKVKEIRASDENNHVLGARYGCHHSTISKVKRGESWNDTANGASVFAWRGA